MGVRGLTTYINKHENTFLKQYYLHDCLLVIDGHSLSAQLFTAINCFAAFGGDYDKYAARVRVFFQQLKRCNVTSYVIFDGGYVKGKLRTAHSRLRSKIYGASRLDPVTQSSLKIFPLFLRDVFKNVLDELQILYTVCELEADDEVAAMARRLDCPVLSYDSDFFIYNVKYIPYHTIETKAVSIRVDGEKRVAIECKIYKIKYFIEHIGDITEDIMPLLATLLGNDFVQKKVFNKFFSQLKLPKGKNKMNEQQRSIQAVIKWLKNETLDSAIEKVIGRVRKAQKRKVYFIIKNSIDGYNRKYCRSLKYFGLDTTEINDGTKIKEYDYNDSDDNSEVSSSSSENGSEESEDALSIKGEEIPDEISTLPDWFVDGIRNRLIPQTYINLYIHHTYFCSPQAEDHEQDDSFLCVLKLLRYAFDILTNYEFDDFIYVSRDKVEYRRITVGREYAIGNPYEDTEPILSVLERMPSYFSHFLKENFPNLDVTVLDCLPETYRLFMLSILWWAKECRISEAQVYSLLLCYIMLDVIDVRVGMHRNHNFFNTKYSKKIVELKKLPVKPLDLEELYLNKNRILYEDSLLAASQLLAYFEIDGEIRKKPRSYDRSRMHIFAQFQCCLQQFIYLNTLCDMPYKNCKIFKCFNGTFVYNVSKKLDQQTDVFNFIENYMLKGSHTVLLYFRSLCKVYDQCIKKLNIVVPKVLGKNCKQKKKRNNASVVDGEFEFEVFI